MHRTTIATAKRGFTLIEMLIVITIVGLLATIAISAASYARNKARDGKRLGDVSRIQTALALYYADNRAFPAGTDLALGGPGATALCDSGWSAAECAGTPFMVRVPSAPTPADGPCMPVQNAYTYTQIGGGADYQLTFCLGGKVGDLPAGVHSGNGDGIL